MKITDIVLLSAALSCAAPAYAEYAMDKDVMDIGLIYCGGVHRPDWTQEELKPYVVHEYADGHKDWFFGSYLFLEYTSGNGIGFGTNYGTNAKKSDWEWLLDRIFAKDKGLDALDKCIEQYKAEIGEPGFRHNIVLGLAVPIDGQSDWGELDGKKMNFNVRSHRLEAEKWYIDQMLSRFEEAGYKNLDLVGFYWIDEDGASLGDFTVSVSDYIHENGYKFYWIPFFATTYNKWEDYGFDLAFLQPNYFFNPNLHPSRVKDACLAAKRNDLALEMEWQHEVLFEYDGDEHGCRIDMLETYIDTFEEQGVYDSSAIAYYSGTKAILQAYQSEHIEDTIILDRIAQYIVDRRNTLGGVEAVDDGSSLYVAGGRGSLYVRSDSGNARIYTIDGRMIAEGNGLIDCPKGIYIVTAGGVSKKVMVK